MERSCQ